MVGAVDGAVAELRQGDAAAVDAAQLPAGAGRRVRTVLPAYALRVILLVWHRGCTVL